MVHCISTVLIKQASTFSWSHLLFLAICVHRCSHSAALSFSNQCYFDDFHLQDFWNLWYRQLCCLSRSKFIESLFCIHIEHENYTCYLRVDQSDQRHWHINIWLSWSRLGKIIYRWMFNHFLLMQQRWTWLSQWHIKMCFNTNNSFKILLLVVCQVIAYINCCGKPIVEKSYLRLEILMFIHFLWHSYFNVNSISFRCRYIIFERIL